MKAVSITWASDVALLVEAAGKIDLDLVAWSALDLEDPERQTKCLASLDGADLILLHPTHEFEWDEILNGAEENIPVVVFGRDPSFWDLSSVPLSIVSRASEYHIRGGAKNIENLLRYIGHEVLGLDWSYDLPEDTFWEGIYHPDAPLTFAGVEDYLEWRRPSHSHTVGLLFFRTYWANGDLEIVDAFIRELECEFDVIPAFCLGMGDEDLGAKSSGEVVEEFFSGRVRALVNLQSIFHAGNVEASRKVLEKLNVPVFHPLMVYHSNEEDWKADSHGMESGEVGWSVALPEFEGAIEPILAGVASSGMVEGVEVERHSALDERVRKVAARVKKWIRLCDAPNSQKRVAFVLHNSPCASLEATIGSAAHLDSLESVVRIMKEMKTSGYEIENLPEDGEELIWDILERKAIAEFRWTSIEEIVQKGGALAQVSREDYESWFDAQSPALKEKVSETWGAPPGEAKDGVPAAMVYEGKIVVTGVRYGNVVVCIQPKRGCAGSRCDGRVCKILHDPELPPPHQYLATYRYLEEDFGADVIVHVGTHGNLEFLPGKSVALSKSCVPDAAIGTLPHLYIYNSDNPPEGTIAKRRSYAVLVDHMQTVMTCSGLYGSLKELDDQIFEYNRTRVSEKSRAHASEHIILDLIREANLAQEIELDRLLEEGAPFDEVLDRVHQKLSEVYGTQIPDGMHIFGEVPSGEKKVDMIRSILRYDSTIENLIAHLTGVDHDDIGNIGDVGDIDDIGKIDEDDLERLSREIIAALLGPVDEGESKCKSESFGRKGASLEAVGEILGEWLRCLDEDAIAAVEEIVMDLASRIDASDEMGSLLCGFDGGYIPAGPSGLITRGRSDVLPTGRNFYSLDPAGVPTKAAWRVGQNLAQALIERHQKDHDGAYPENVATYWMASDVMWCDGEQLAQMLFLIGVEPVWKGGRVKGYRVMSPEELGRPRIDLTVRVSGITRDCFFNCIEFLDDAIRKVASLDESSEMNYLRRHNLENESESENESGVRVNESEASALGAAQDAAQNADRNAARIFASKPGTYGNGVNLAVYASAWETEADLSDVFVYWNGYAYGKGVFGEAAHDQLKSQLRSVDLTFNKTVTDEYDLFGCCCYFGTHGGLTAAAKEHSHKSVATYYGDTRDPKRVAVRTLAEEVRRVVRTKLLNPKWIDGMKRHGYKGAGDISKRVGRVYGWEATTEEVDDWVFDEVAKTFVLDEEMRRFFQEENPWALEEMGRRLLEAHQRGLWEADPDLIEELKEAYLEMEGWLEEGMDGASGSIQGGSIDAVTAKEVESWREKMGRVLGK